MDTSYWKDISMLFQVILLVNDFHKCKHYLTFAKYEVYTYSSRAIFFLCLTRSAFLWNNKLFEIFIILFHFFMHNSRTAF